MRFYFYPIRLTRINQLFQIALETEVSNTAAMKLYERLGFLRSKRLHRYYLNGNTAFRLVLYLKEGVGLAQTANNWDPFENGQANMPPSVYP